MKNVFGLAIAFLLLVGYGMRAQEAKDTLYFRLDGKYVYESPYETEVFLIKDSNEDETFFFNKDKIVYGLDPEKVLCLKKYIRSSTFYDRKRKRKLNDWKLYEHFEHFTIILQDRSKNENKYVKVSPGHVVQ